MKQLIKQLNISVSDGLFVKRPESSELGKRILQEGLVLLEEVGYDQFNFRKLAVRLMTTESSIYRYFESKRQLLMYFHSFYWGWLECMIVFSLMNVEEDELKLRKIIAALHEHQYDDEEIEGLKVGRLTKVVCQERERLIFSNEIKQELACGVFDAQKRVIDRIVEVFKEINPSYRFPRNLVTLLLNGILSKDYYETNLSFSMDQENNDEMAFYFSIIKNQLFSSENGR